MAVLQGVLGDTQVPKFNFWVEALLVEPSKGESPEEVPIWCLLQVNGLLAASNDLCKTDNWLLGGCFSCCRPRIPCMGRGFRG